MDLKKQILVALGLDKGEEVNMEWQAKSEDGTIFVSTADELAEGVDVSVLTEDGSTILLPPGSYKTEDGVTFRVDEEGIVASLIGNQKEELAEEEEEVEERGTTPKSIKTTEVVEFSIEDLKAENERLKTELAAQPASAPLDTNKFSAERATPTAQDFKRMTKQEKFLYNLHN